MDIRLTQAALKGKITAFTREVRTLEKDDDDDKYTQLIKKIKKQIDVTNDEIKKLSELIKKIKDGNKVNVDLKAIEKKIPTIAEIRGIEKKKKNSKK